MPLAIPTIHLNGTSREMLSDQLCEAYSAVRIAGDTLAKAAPNGRDYYPQGPEAFEQAVREHYARMAKLRDVMKEIETIAEAIAFA
jgi:ferredoxin-NADP reductase